MHREADSYVRAIERCTASSRPQRRCSSKKAVRFSVPIVMAATHLRSSAPGASALAPCYDRRPMPPIWLHEYGQHAQTRPCPRRGCREIPIRRCRYETLCQIGWPLFLVARYVEWCGHGQEPIPVPDEGEGVRLVPVIGMAK